MRVVIDQEKCVAAGQCNIIAPEVFDQGDDGIVVLLNEFPPPALHGAVREAAHICPALAIDLIEP